MPELRHQQASQPLPALVPNLLVLVLVVLLVLKLLVLKLLVVLLLVVLQLQQLQVLLQARPLELHPLLTPHQALAYWQLLERPLRQPVEHP